MIFNTLNAVKGVFVCYKSIIKVVMSLLKFLYVKDI